MAGRRDVGTGEHGAGAGPSAPPPVAAPAPLTEPHLAAIPGVLGRIARERAADYAAAPRVGARDRASPPREEAPEERSEGGVPRPKLSAALLAAKREAEAAGLTPLAFIAEIKRSSPSQGHIAPLDPVRAAREYLAGGAAALSVLTEPRHFGGDLGHLRAVAVAVPLPLLRKEFVVHPEQVREAVAARASAVLLMVSVLGEATGEYLRYAEGLGLEALVEVHDARELAVALEAGARVLGVNNRDLATLAVDLGTAPKLIAAARERGYAGVSVAESGYATNADLASVAGLADAVLVGTSLAGSGDLTGALRRLRGGAERT
ncbi:MAG: indole-3-glycerol phosphate synthase TrpC [Trueperaceae bacterium]|nr:indole-3-glycerol phosphate synthase TrpC [Trueperaceae bacterium]